jgi:hypothetical protein
LFPPASAIAAIHSVPVFIDRKEKTMKLIACALCLCVLGSSAVVIAEPNSSGSKVDNYQYVFTDDPVAAGLLDQTSLPIVARTRVVRGTLIRPRTAFVMEMLKSVEAL